MSDAPKSYGRLAARPTFTPRELVKDSPELARAWTARIITLFPGAFPGVLGESLTGKALAQGIWQLQTFDLREFGIGKHRNVDDTPAGGGAGMVLRPDVTAAAIRAAMTGTKGRWPLIYLSPRGRRFDQQMARDFAGSDGITMLCGRFGLNYGILHTCTLDSMGHRFYHDCEEMDHACYVMDEMLAPFLRKWRDAGYEVIVTADHGQDERGHHGGKTPLQQEFALYYFGPGQGPAGNVVLDQLALAPTILTRLGVAVPKTMNHPPFLTA